MTSKFLGFNNETQKESGDGEEEEDEGSHFNLQTWKIERRYMIKQTIINFVREHDPKCRVSVRQACVSRISGGMVLTSMDHNFKPKI